MAFIPDRESKIPLYRQLSDYLISTIEGLSEQGGGPLPSEREMNSAYGVSRSTVRQALQYLEDRRYITRRQGSGTYAVKQQPVISLMQMYSFTKEMERMGKKTLTKLIALTKTGDYGQTIRDKLQLQEGEAVYAFRRLRYADNVISMLENTYVPCRLLPDLTDEMLINSSFYTLLQERYHIFLDYAEQEFEVTGAREEEAAFLGIKNGDPVMLAVRTSYAKDVPVEYSKCLIPRGGMRYRVELRM